MPVVATDLFASKKAQLTVPSEKYSMITPSDTDDLAYVSREIVVGTPGDVKVKRIDGTDVTIPESVWTVRPSITIRAKKIYATGTTATDILALP